MALQGAVAARPETAPREAQNTDPDAFPAGPHTAATEHALARFEATWQGRTFALCSEEHREEFRRPPQLAVSQITVPSEEAAESVAPKAGRKPVRKAARSAARKRRGKKGARA